MAWLFLVLAGMFEVVWAVGLKYTEGFTKIIPSTITILAMVFSFWFLTIALKDVPLSTAYAVWTGIGIIGTVLFGIFWFKEPADIMRIIFISFILIGIVGLKIC